MKRFVRTAIASGGDDEPNHDRTQAVFEAAWASMNHLRLLEAQLAAEHPELKPHLAAIVNDCVDATTANIKKFLSGAGEVAPDDDN